MFYEAVERLVVAEDVMVESTARAIFKNFLSPKPAIAVNVSEAARREALKLILEMRFDAREGLFERAVREILSNLQDRFLAFVDEEANVRALAASRAFITITIQSAGALPSLLAKFVDDASASDAVAGGDDEA